MFIQKKIGDNNPLKIQPKKKKSCRFRALAWIFAFMFALAMIIAGSNEAQSQEIMEDGRVLYSFGDELQQTINKAEDWIFKVRLVGHYSEEQKKNIQRAWSISGGDMDFLYMLKAENGWLTHDRRHDPKNNTVGVDWGFCGTNDYFHAEKVNDPRFFSDPVWQLSKCYEMFIGGTTFYGANRVKNDKVYAEKIKSHFELYI